VDRVEALQADIGRAPAAMGDLLDGYLGPSGPLDALDPALLRGRRVAFAGLGSSRYASLDATFALRAGGMPAWAEYASAEGSPPASDLVVVAVSASGRTAEVVQVARRHRGTSLVIGVTNVPDSPLAAECDVVLPLLAGAETAGISTLTYRATVVVLALLAGRFGLPTPDIAGLRATVDDLEAIAEAEDGWVGTVVSAATDRLDGAHAIDVLGPASRQGAVSQAALMLREAPRLPAVAHETADWLHTAVYLALPGHRALLFTGSPADAEVVDTIRRRGGEVVVVGGPAQGAAVSIDVPAVGPDLRTIVESAMVDRLALELWRRVSGTAAVDQPG
jgi:Glucosamine 6-phosphate synthetase, contains amidotransferase and phosphosugar isomerase domains